VNLTQLPAAVFVVPGNPLNACSIAEILIYISYIVALMPDKDEKDSDKKIREMTKDIVNALLESGENMRVDIRTVSDAAKCGASFDYCSEYNCASKFRCTSTAGFECGGKFKDSADYTLTL
jgi:hypothetical protein